MPFILTIGRLGQWDRCGFKASLVSLMGSRSTAVSQQTNQASLNTFFLVKTYKTINEDRNYFLHDNAVVGRIEKQKENIFISCN